MDDYGQALLIDVVTVVGCMALLLRYGGLRFSHPGTPYILFHLHTVTSRLLGLLNGAPLLYSDFPGWLDPITPVEIARAAFYADGAFWSVTVVWILLKAVPGVQRKPPQDYMKLNPKILRPILLVAFVLGVIGLRVAANIPGLQAYGGFSQSTEWSSSSYLIILPSWFGLAVLGHIYYYDFRRSTSILLGIYLILMSLQGGFRFRVVLGLLLAVTIWVERRNRRWPSALIVATLAVSAVSFFPMKTVGTMVRTGASLDEMSTAFSESVADASEGAAPDMMFLDEFASALTLLDLQGHKYYGSIYLPLITLPIPRALWPDKPALSPYVKDISTRFRPMSDSGMIATYLGESYANFGLAGIFIVPPLLAALLSLFYRRAIVAPYDSVLRFAYILLSANLIQVYRDGLCSLVVFTFVNMMPLAAIVVVHIVASSMRKRRRIPLALPGQPLAGVRR